ncbi:4-alpha-glucanotransferase [Paraflavisolibacter sp. H34]|uniref:4-alpha-glucanotransferase n=1 Tax=Huijunlia imazamoxiresistens TaxID=3127457 RepID=UPI003018CF89
MRIDFYLRYHTLPGQNLFLTGNLVTLGNYHKDHALPMRYLNEEFWFVSLEVETFDLPALSYRYVFRDDRGNTLLDGEKHRHLKIEGAPGHLVAVDTWNSTGEYENAFYTAPFTRVLTNEDKFIESRQPDCCTHTFKVKAPLLGHDECVCLLGAADSLGNWNESAPVLLHREREWWVASVDLSAAYYPIAYKYGVYNFREGRFVRYEGGENRHLNFPGSEGSRIVLHDNFVYRPNNTWKGAGLAIPVFSLRSNDSFGIGEFNDIRLLADWAALTGMKLIQLLPVNDTTATLTWKDSYPYAAISAFALNPVYLHLEAVAGPEHAGLLEPLARKKKELGELPVVDYEKVLHAKLNVMRELFEAKGDGFLHSDDYRKFFDSNAFWLIPYAAFCHFRDLYGTPDYSQWLSHKVYREEEIKQLCSPSGKHYREIAFWYFVQYHLHLQLRDAIRYAHGKGLVLKGDIPIGIYRFGCDAWMAPEQYHMDMQAGAPPDAFAVKGQNWGFPTYNWKKMQEDQFEWWHRRFHQMSHYFDAFRIDHILGFFRIWSVPMHAVEGIMGVFVPAQALHLHEFESRGIRFDYDRFCRPYITDDILQEIFGSDADWVRGEFLDRNDRGGYDLKEAVNTQRKVEALLATWNDDETTRRVKLGLFDLISNVLLFEEGGSGGQLFHFRISMEKTASFQRLDDYLKGPLYNFYIDYFYYRQDECWKKEALKKLPALKDVTHMLICGEDLGMVPHSVPEVMQQLGILSLEIQRMPKDPKIEFFHPKDAPYLSVVTPSTHDMSTVRGWWEEDRPGTQKFYNEIMGREGVAPFFCEPEVNRDIVLQHLHSPAMWSIFQLQDLLGISGRLRRENPHDERINEPSDPAHYWRYRMHLTLEDLLQQTEFNDELKTYITNSGR